MNKQQFKTFMSINNLNQLIKINDNYPKRSINYTLSDGYTHFDGKLTQKTFISLINDGTLIFDSKEKINGYTFKYSYKVVV